MPTPIWAQCRVELYEEPGFLDDCFRSSLWVKFQSAASESFGNVNDVAGDYASMAVTEGAAVNGCGWRRDISGLNLSTSTYPVFRVRLRGRDTAPQYKVEVEYTDASSTSLGWIDAPTSFEAVWLQLTSGKTVKYVKLYARSSQVYAQAVIDYDYACVLKNPPLVPAEIEELVADLVTTTAVSGLRLTMLRDPAYPRLALWLPMDEGQDTRAYDLSPWGRTGHLYNGPLWVDGKYGKALSFDGSDDYVQTVAFALSGTALTFATWIKPSYVAGVYQTLISDGAQSSTIGFIWCYRNPGSYHFTWQYADGTAYRTAQSNNFFAGCDGVWTHVAVVCDYAAKTVRFYRNGVFIEELSMSGVPVFPSVNRAKYLGKYNAAIHPLTGCLDDTRIYIGAFSDAEVYRLYTSSPLSGAQRAGPGCVVMAYLGAASESLVSKLFTGRVIDRLTLGEPDNPVTQLVCEDLGEILLERTFSKEYASATQISTIVDDMLDESPELYQDKDTTNRAIVNRFHQEGVWSLLEKLAETATFASSETGANFWVDTGGTVRFKKYGVFVCPLSVTDGSGGGTPNILDIQVKESIKGSPRLTNDVRVIVFEEETQPSDGDALTESVEGWSSPDPTDGGYPQSDTGDKVAGSASVHFNTTNPGSYYRMRVEFPDLDITGFDSLKFQLKYGSGLSVDSLEVRIWRGGWLWVTDYYEETGITPQSAAAWHEYTMDLASMSKTGNPGSVIANVQIKAVHMSQVGTGGFLIDNLRFVRYEKAGTASDSTSQAAYGKRTLRLVDKTITDVDYAGYVASNILAHRKNPVVTAQVRAPGRAQLGYRPPQTVTVTSLKDGLEARSFQIVRAQHRYTPGGGYVCDLDLAAARLPDGSYEPRVAPAVADVGLGLAALRRMRYETGLNSLRSVWV
ncbi:MAG: LamG domain-containing protein [Candidatus Bathyarchaeota archaeon]